MIKKLWRRLWLERNSNFVFFLLFILLGIIMFVLFIDIPHAAIFK